MDPAGLQIVIYSVRFEFYLNTQIHHVLFLAFRWGGLCVGLHYNIVVSAVGCMAAGAHAPSAAARRRKKKGISATKTVMKKGNIVFHTGNMARD